MIEMILELLKTGDFYGVSEIVDVAKGIKSFKKGMSSEDDTDDKNISNKNNKNSES